MKYNGPFENLLKNAKPQTVESYNQTLTQYLHDAIIEKIDSRNEDGNTKYYILLVNIDHGNASQLGFIIELPKALFNDGSWQTKIILFISSEPKQK